METMLDKLVEIGRLFKLKGNLIKFETITEGNINYTLRVFYDNNKSYIFQRVNIDVFKDPIGVMRNIDNVTTYIREEFPQDVSLHYHHTIYGDNYIIYAGEFWRVMSDFNSATVNSCESLDEIKSIGEAFGEYQRKLKNFDASTLIESIKDFHNTELRLNTLLSFADENDIKMPEIEYIRSVKDKASKISSLYNAGLIPSRPCHNDTKANNVLLDRVTLKPIVVIDLDTLMPGVGLYDFADGARFICSTAKEDESDLTKVDFDLDKFKAFSEGFISKVKEAWEPIEIDNIVLSVFSITVELASRFLLDYISGNKYFKTTYPEHNLDRTRCQIKLAQSIEAKSEELQKIIDKII